MESTIPVVTLCHILLNVIDGETQYFATPNEIDCEGAIKIPENAIWVALGNTKNNWIEIHPVEIDNPVLQDYIEDPSYYEVVLDESYGLLPGVRADIENCRLFALLTD